MTTDRPTLDDLTPRQRDVVSRIADGLTDKQIGAELHMQPNTVRVHVVAIAYRLGIPGGKQTRVLIARWWWNAQSAPSKGAA